MPDTANELIDFDFTFLGQQTVLENGVTRYGTQDVGDPDGVPAAGPICTAKSEIDAQH